LGEDGGQERGEEEEEGEGREAEEEEEGEELLLRRRVGIGILVWNLGLGKVGFFYMAFNQTKFYCCSPLKNGLSLKDLEGVGSYGEARLVVKAATDPFV
jgi:hypothetical protein